MIAFTSIWLLVGLIVIIVLLILSIMKKLKWRYWGLSLAIYLLFSFIFLIISGSPSVVKQQSQDKREFSILSKKSDRINGDLIFDTDEDGNYILKIKGLEDGQVTISDDNDKTIKTVDIHKNKTEKVKIHVPKNEDEYNLVATDDNDHSKGFTIMNDSDSHIDSNTSDDDSDSSSSSTKDSSYQASLDARKNNWNSSSDGDTIHVSKVWQDKHTAFVAVNDDDWDNLSESEKYDFANDWTDNIQKIYSMSDKNGTTSVQIVSSDNHYHMFAHSNGAGKVKLDD